MKNLMKKIRKNNKGFTLVELIIVIAVIAILTAVAAPQYIKYVERSENATLEAAGHEVETVAKSECAMGYLTGSGDITVAGGSPITITVGSGLTYNNGVASETFADMFTDLGNSDSSMSYVITITDGVVTGSTFS